MTLVEHLYELRYRLGMALLAAGVGALVCCLWFNVTIWPIPTLSHVVLYPYCHGTSHTLTDLVGKPGKECGLLQTKPFEGFSTLLQVGITTGVVLTSPFWLHQLWAFITPGLHRKERRFGVSFVSFGSVLFLLGAVVAYLLLPEVLRVMTNVAGSDNLLTAFSASDYVSFLINLLVVFGISFELPLVVVMLNFSGVLRYEKVRHWRRGFFFAIVIFAALVTPGTDAISMVILAAALCLLFEMALQLARVHDKRIDAKRRDEGWDTDDPDTPSKLDHTPDPVFTPQPAAHAGPTPATEQAEADRRPRRHWYDDAT
ncbi:twin-arginine translocase subunit TatC [Sciscionella marina]|uniref:twin-arginine translocase subunit TatC n=1 Tax=Sciscionella marina TaxID=508770 RepID=UPI00037C952B|nr:twin-arginine translocase subunit TatC [Sciscionella marina]